MTGQATPTGMTGCLPSSIALEIEPSTYVLSCDDHFQLSPARTVSGTALRAPTSQNDPYDQGSTAALASFDVSFGFNPPHWAST